jgi:hypothetical protein
MKVIPPSWESLGRDKPIVLAVIPKSLLFVKKSNRFLSAAVHSTIMNLGKLKVVESQLAETTKINRSLRFGNLIYRSKTHGAHY